MEDSDDESPPADEADMEDGIVSEGEADTEGESEDIMLRVYHKCCKSNFTSRGLRCNRVVFEEMRSELGTLNELNGDWDQQKDLRIPTTSISRCNRWRRKILVQTAISQITIKT